jgi:hypothetical protein
MGLDLTCLSAAAAVRLLNSTRLGTVITERRLYRHRLAGGLAIGDERGIHLVRYARWLARRLASRMTGMGKSAKHLEQRQAEAYHDHRDRVGQDQAEKSAKGRDIGSIPAVKNPKLREECRRSLRRFAETYFPERFSRPWSNDHLLVISKIEASVLRGELCCIAMPRSFGKSSLAEVAAIWAAVYGYRLYIMLLAASKPLAEELLESIKTVLQDNERLAADFPEVCLPIGALEGHANRCKGQTCRGVPTKIIWKANYIVLPNIAGSLSAQVRIEVAGLTGSFVGRKYTRADGSVVRPDFVFLDDPQDYESAHSPGQTATRERIIQSSVLGLSGMGKSMTALMCCTVIAAGDLSDRFLSHEKHPEWRGVRTKAVYAWPKNEKLWEHYHQLWLEAFTIEQRWLKEDTERLRENPAAAIPVRSNPFFKCYEHYRKNRRAMDDGAEVAWPEAYDEVKGEISGLQSMMNLRYRLGDDAFFSEYQNEPIKEHADSELLGADAIAAKVNGLEAGKIPIAANYLTLFMDPHDKLIWYALVAWGEGFTGWVIDYGAYPDQKKRYFTMRSAQKTLARACPGAGREGAILAGLRECEKLFLGRTWPRDDGVPMKVQMALVDSGWETDTVNAYVRSSASAIVLPAKGLPVKAADKPWEERPKKPGQQRGHHWLLATISSAKGRYVQHDANYWKTFLHQRLAAAQGDAGCLSLHGRLRSDRQPANLQLHRMLADHLVSEYRTKTSGHGRTLDEWKQPPNRPDNHLLDCLAGCCVAASMLGIPVMGQESPKTSANNKKSRRRVTYI